MASGPASPRHGAPWRHGRERFPRAAWTRPGNREASDATGASHPFDLAGYMDEVKAQTANAGAQIGIAVVKRRNKSTASTYVVMSLEQFAEMSSVD